MPAVKWMAMPPTFLALSRSADVIRRRSAMSTKWCWRRRLRRLPPLLAAQPEARWIKPEVEPEIRSYPVLPGDIFLLCSDGLNDMVEDEEIGLTLQTLSANLELAATQLIQMANDNGGRDNISVVLTQVVEPFPARHGILNRISGWFR